MVAQPARGWLLYIAHFRRFIKVDFPKEIARLEDAGADTFVQDEQS
jgi:hypothetical protein